MAMKSTDNVGGGMTLEDLVASCVQRVIDDGFQPPDVEPEHIEVLRSNGTYHIMIRFPDGECAYMDVTPPAQ
jgi:hypothetical protein